MRKIKRILKSIDSWIHDVLTHTPDFYFKKSHALLPDSGQVSDSALLAIHNYDIKKFGSITSYLKLKIMVKSRLYAVYVFIRKWTLHLLLRIFLFRDKVLGKNK